MNNTQAAGFVTGGVISDGGSGTIDISSGSGYIRASNSATAEIFAFDFSGTTGLALTNLVTNYIYVDYNGGSPTVGAEIAKAANGRTKFYLGKVFREGTSVHIVDAGQNVSEPLKRIQGRINAVFGEIQRATGMNISESGTRNFDVSAGTL